MARPRIRAALLVGALVATATPLLAQAVAPKLSCGITQTGRWERLPVDTFRPISGIAGSTANRVTSYTVDEQRPQDLAVTNGFAVQRSTSNGCSWSTVYSLSATPTGAEPFVGAQSQIVSVALLSGRSMAAIQEGSGSASRPHVVVSDAGGTTWTTRDNGLPSQGAPRLLRAASDGRTAYLTISPTATGGDDGGGTGGVIPPLPGGGNPVTGTPTGFLYRTTDGGGTWTLQTGATDLPGGGTGFSQLDIDPSDSNRLYGIVGGRLLTSRDGGGTFTAAPGSGYTAVTATGPLAIAAFNSGGGVLSSNGGGTFTALPAPAGITSVAARTADSNLAIETNGSLKLLDPTGKVTNVPAAVSARPGSLLGDRGNQSSFHALAGDRAVLRYVDTVPPGVTVRPAAVGDLTVPPPNPGFVSPRARNVQLQVGESGLADFALDLPKNPTPLDLFFLVDISTGMGSYVETLQAKIRDIVSRLEAAGVDLKVGVGTIGTGQARGENSYPPFYTYPPQPDLNNPGQTRPGRTYTKPVLYKRLRAVGQTGPELQKAIDQLALETVPLGSYENREGQLVALKQVAEGQGQRTVTEEDGNLPTFSDVPPGQGAEFRGNPGIRRIVIMASNEKFDAPFGTDEQPESRPLARDVRLNFKPTIDMLRRNRIQVLGLTAGEIEAQPDLRTIAKGSGMLAPPGGVSCGGDPAQELSAGDPLVCNSADNFAEVISRVLASLVDRQSVQLVPRTRTPVLGALAGKALLGLDVKKPNRAPFQVRVSCIDVKPGTYAQDVDLLLRQTVVGRARVNVSCLKADAVTRPRPVVVDNAPNPPAAQPAPNPAVPPPAPLPPAAQPQAQPQVQTQVQVQPLTAAAVEEQQQLQLALALNGTLKDDDPVFNAGQQMAMVDRRKREEVQALGIMAFAVLTCAGLGLAGLRARPDVNVRRAR